jgi:hypothetical protein
MAVHWLKIPLVFPGLKGRVVTVEVILALRSGIHRARR